MLVLDEAFSQAGLLCYGCAEMHAHEVISLIETMVPSDALLKSLSEGTNAWSNDTNGSGTNDAADAHEDETRLRHAVLYVNLLDTERFANQLQEYGWKVGFLSPGYFIPIEAAELAAARMMTMATETWLQVREVLLRHCGMQRPSTMKWDIPGGVSELATAMADTPVDRFLVCSTGSALLALPHAAARSTIGFSSSVLLLRFHVYQKLLSLLEGWYPSGVKANDTYAGMNAWGLVDTGLHYNKKKQSVEPAAASSTSSVNERGVSQCVELCPFPKLLLSLMTLNRLLCSHLGAQDLSTIAARTAGLTGLLLQWSSYDDDVAESKGAAASAISATCRWILLGELPLPVSLVPALADSGFLRCTPLNKHAVNDAFITETKDRDETFTVELLSPFGCVRALYEDPCAVELQAAGVVKVEAFTDGMLTASGVTLGSIVRIDPMSSLEAACQRFNWWDRPADTILKSMAGCLAEVVGTAEVFTKHRAGVRVIAKPDGKPYTGVLLADALPVECLTYASLPVVSTTFEEEEAELALAAAAKAKSKKGKKGKIRRRRGRKSQESSTVSDPSTIQTTDSFAAEEIGEGSGHHEDKGEFHSAEQIKQGPDTHHISVQSSTTAAAAAASGLQLESPRTAAAKSNTELTPILVNSKRCKCATFYFHGVCEHVSEPASMLTGKYIAKESKELRLHEEETGNDFFEDVLHEQQLISPLVKLVVKNNEGEVLAVDDARNYGKVVAFGEANHFNLDWTDTSTPRGEDTRPVLFSAKRIPGDIPILGKRRVEPLVPKVAFSAFSWMKPQERKSLEQIWQEAEEERIRKKQEQEEDDNDPDLENPLQFLAVDGKKYESFGVYRLQGRASEISMKRPDQRGQPAATITTFPSKIAVSDAIAATKYAEKNADKAIRKLEEYNNALLDETLVDEFVMRARSDPDFEGIHNESNVPVPVSVSVPMSVSAVPTQERLNGMHQEIQLEELLQTIITSDTEKKKSVAKERLMEEILEVESNLQALELERAKIVQVQFDPVQPVAVFNRQEQTKSHEELLKKSASAASSRDVLKLPQGLSRAPSFQPKEIIIKPKPLAYWQRQAWTAMAEGKPREFNAIIRNSYKLERDQEEAETRKRRKRVEQNILRTSLSKGRSSLRAGSAQAIAGEFEQNELFTDTGRVDGKNIGQYFKAPANVDNEVLAELQRQTVKAENAKDGFLEEGVKGCANPRSPRDLHKKIASQELARLTMDMQGNIPIPQHHNIGLALYPPLAQVPSDLQDPLPPTYVEQPTGEDDDLQFDLKVSRTELYLSVMEDVINKQVHVPSVSISRNANSSSHQKEKNPEFLQWQQLLEHPVGKEPTPNDADYSHANVTHRNRNNPAIHREYSSWTEKAAAPNPHPPKFPKRTPFVQLGQENQSTSLRPLTGLPAAQLYKAPGQELSARESENSPELHKLLGFTAMEGRPPRSPTIPRNAPSSQDQDQDDKAPESTKIPTLPGINTGHEDDTVEFNLSPNVSRKYLNEAEERKVDDRATASMAIFGDRILSEALLALPITQANALHAIAPEYQKREDRFKQLEQDRLDRLERSRVANTGDFDFQPLVTALLDEKDKSRIKEENELLEENRRKSEEKTKKDMESLEQQQHMKPIVSVTVVKVKEGQSSTASSTGKLPFLENLAQANDPDVGAEEDYANQANAPASQSINIFG